MPLHLPAARAAASSALYWLAMAEGTAAGDKINLLDYAARLADGIDSTGAALAKGLGLALGCQQANGSNKAEAESAALWCSACWCVWVKPGSVRAAEMGSPPPPPPPP